MLRPPKRTPPTSRKAIVGLTLALAAVIAGFAWISIQSYELLHNEVAREASSDLEPVKVVGPEETVFDWSRQACEPRDIPDEPARAYRDARGRVHLFASHYVTRADIGGSLDDVRHDCQVALRSKLSARPQEFADREWIASPYTLDGRTVFALVHDEYHGWQHTAGDCATRTWQQCLYNAVTLVRSDDSGRTFRHAAPGPGHLVAAVPYRYEPGGGTYGVFNPSNIVEKDGFYYSLVVVQAYRAQRAGTCLMRTRDLGDPRSWRAWNGDGFDVTFVNPYLPGAEATSDHLCKPVSRDQIGTMSGSLTYNTYFDKYLLVGPGSSFEGRKRRTVHGFYYSLSDDLIEWSPRKLIKEAELPWTYKCGDRDPVVYPSVLDSSSSSRNFETTGQRVHLYFTQEHYSGCRETLNRDLVRVPIEFSK